MNNLIRKVPRITQVLHYFFLSALIILVLFRIQEFPYHQEVLLICKVLGGLLIVSITAEILMSSTAPAKKLQWLSSVILPQLIASIFIQEFWLLAIALSALVYVNVIRKKLFSKKENHNRPSW